MTVNDFNDPLLVDKKNENSNLSLCRPASGAIPALTGGVALRNFWLSRGRAFPAEARELGLTRVKSFVVADFGSGSTKTTQLS